MKILKNQKGFTLIELVLIIVILGVLGAVATVQFGNILRDANNAALDGGAGSYSTQLALEINSLKRLPTAGEWDSDVFLVAQPSGGNVTHVNTATGVVTMTITAATCEDVWTYAPGTGAFTRTSTARGGC